VSIIGWPNTVMDNRFYALQVLCPDTYPDVPPKIRFISKINMAGVDPKNGAVSPTLITGWTRTSTIASALCTIRNHMKAACKNPQPPEGEEFKP
jgi:ubiquitin-conjugating enzyme E2 variant